MNGGRAKGGRRDVGGLSRSQKRGMQMDDNAAQVNLKKLPGQLLARGRTADVYAWEDGYVLKLFRKSSLDDVKYEARIARAVHASGLAVPVAGEIVQVNAQYGLVYQRMDGPTMLEVMSTKPWRLFYYARRMAATCMLADANQTSLLNGTGWKARFAKLRLCRCRPKRRYSPSWPLCRTVIEYVTAICILATSF